MHLHNVYGGFCSSCVGREKLVEENVETRLYITSIITNIRF